MAAYEVLLLNTAVPQIQAAQSGDTYVVPRDIAINATAIISANSATDALRITQTGAGNAILVEDSANPDSTPFVVTAAGDVGIGTTNPAARLHVVSTSADAAIVASNQVSTLQYFVSSGTTQGPFVGGNSNDLLFGTTGSARMRLDSSGNLGLGVTPSAWNTVTALQAKNASFGGFSNNAYLSANWYYQSADKYIASDFATSYQQASGQHRWYNAPSGNANDPITFIQAMTLDASGNLAVGDTSSSRRLKAKFDSNTVYSASSMETTSLLTYITNGSTTVGAYSGIHFNTGGDGDAAIAGVRTAAGDMALTFGTRGTGSGNIIERARITSGGYFKASNSGSYVGATGAYHELVNDFGDYIAQARNSVSSGAFGIRIQYSGSAPNGTGNEFLYCDDNASGGTLRAAIRSNGGLANYSANNVNLASDERLKKDISLLATTWDKLKQIEVVNFRYKDCNEGDPLLYGVIAQQVQPIVPELVVVTREAKEAVEAKDAVLDENGKVIEPAVEAKEATPDYYGIREQPMYWLAIKALQEAMARIEKLEAEVAALKGA